MSRPLDQLDAPSAGYVAHCFTPAQADRALVLVRRVVADIVRHHRRVVELQDTIEAGSSGGHPGPVREAREELRTLAGKFGMCLEEMEDIGVELRDFDRGAVDFPCLVEGRHAFLCWRLGERRVRHWHELGETCAQRRRMETMRLDAPSVAR
jgi:hypothetical protein